MHKLFEKQVEEARRPDGDVDLDVLGRLVTATYEDMGGSDLRAQNILFDAAVNNMQQGLLLIDARGRVLICNQRYRDMYGLAPEQASPGIHLGRLLKNRADIGTFVGDPEKHAADLIADFSYGHMGSRTLDIGDGRTIAISNRIIPGSGWVSTHEDVTERRRNEQQIAHMAHHDALTDLPNRVLLRERLAAELQAIRRGSVIAVHYLDLDHFKTVNDTLGHPIGDELLRAVADRLRTCVSATATVARVGGDEFAIVQTGITTPAEAGLLARRVRDLLSEPYNLHGHVAIVNASVGIALAPNDGEEPDTLIKSADMALYRAKGDGRGTYRFFESEMDTRMQSRRTLELALREALARSEFELHYQPVVNIADGAIVSCEALIRWRHPEHGMISPAEFIPLAEEIGMIVPLGDWVLRQACADAGAWPDNIKVAVNLSPTQIGSRKLVPSIMQTLAANRLNPDRLIIEITEAVLMRNSEATIATLYQLRSLGIQVALDDFGTGFSSLSYLRSFPFDKLKIDRSFISGLDDGDEDISIVRAVAGLARSLRIATTAEGVETEHQLEQVRELGCTEMQGHLFSAALPARDLSCLMARHNGSRNVA